MECFVAAHEVQMAKIIETQEHQKALLECITADTTHGTAVFSTQQSDAAHIGGAEPAPVGKQRKAAQKKQEESIGLSD